MSFSLTRIATALADASSIATNAVTLTATTVTVATTIYKYGANMIEAAESAYASQTAAGASKKSAVLAALQAFVTDLGENWSKMVTELSSWIDMVIAAWKSALALVSDLTTSTGGASSETAAVTAVSTATALPAAASSSTAVSA